MGFMDFLRRMFTPSGWGYSRLEMWMEANYGLNVGGKPESPEVLLRLDSIYQQELSKGVSEKKLRGLHAYIQTQKNKELIIK